MKIYNKTKKNFILLAILAVSIIFITCKESKKLITYKESKKAQQPSGTLLFPSTKGPYQFNGASPWYTEVTFGSNQQKLKTIFDTGNNFVWATSTQCNTPACTQEGRIRFNPNTSTTFKWVDENISSLSWGPWGNMKANTGSDIIGQARQNVYLAVDYNGDKFQELNWDAGISFPASSSSADPKISAYLKSLLDAGAVSPDDQNILYLAFYSDISTRTGHFKVGKDWDQDLVDLNSRLDLPYKEYSSLGYLWTTPLKSWSVGDATIKQTPNTLFCVDSGSSRFKGDKGQLNDALQEIEEYIVFHKGKYPPLQFNFEQGRKIQVLPEQYRVLIEKGTNKGETVTAINPNLAIDDLILVGTVMMDYLYTLYKYEVTKGNDGYTFVPIGVSLFNLKKGPKMIIN